MRKLGFIGSGQMATAILSGLISSNESYQAKDINVFDINTNKMLLLNEQFKVNTSVSSEDLIDKSDIVILAIKPNSVVNFFSNLKYSGGDTIFVSIISGFPIKAIASYLPKNSKIVRVMPNTPSLIHAGFSAIVFNENILTEEKKEVENIFKSIGDVLEIDEEYVNAISAIASSGPAYFYLILEAISDAGVKIGLDRKLSLELAAKTAIGGSRMVLESGIHPAQLKDMVTSPGGTTIEAIHMFEKTNLRGSLIDGINAAFEKSKDQERKILEKIINNDK